MIEGVERTGDAVKYVKGVLDRKERLMGFGHRVYRAYDPRAAVLRDTCKRLGAPRYEVALELEKAAIAELAERYPERRMETNVDYWAAVLLDFAEVPGEMMTPLFVGGPHGGLVGARPRAEAHRPAHPAQLALRRPRRAPALGRAGLPRPRLTCHAPLSPPPRPAPTRSR